MPALAERQVRVVAAAEIQTVRIGEHLRVAVAGAEEEETELMLADPLSADLQVFESHTDVSNGGFSDATGEVDYAISRRTLQPYVVRSVTKVSSFDPVSQLATDSTQVTEIDSDSATGRSLGGKTRTESVSVGTFPDGTRHGLRTVHTVSEETLKGLKKANGVAMVLRETNSETLL